MSSLQFQAELISVIEELTGEEFHELPGMEDTPKRYLKALAEMTVGYQQSPKMILGTVFDIPYDEMVILKNIPFSSLCEHHLLPFSGQASIGYLPGNSVVGLSKLARIVDCFALRFQVQERMTRQIAEAIMSHLEPLGVGVIVEAVHQCMSCRGVKKPGSSMITSTMLGAFRDDPQARGEFLTLIGNR